MGTLPSYIRPSGRISDARDHVVESAALVGIQYHGVVLPDGLGSSITIQEMSLRRACRPERLRRFKVTKKQRMHGGVPLCILWCSKRYKYTSNNTIQSWPSDKLPN